MTRPMRWLASVFEEIAYSIRLPLAPLRRAVNERRACEYDMLAARMDSVGGLAESAETLRRLACALRGRA